ncbi:unnamed protein product [Brassicogethes aeneus]|uniref:Receptor L-domain domain-containing protein n=1 Tax=Brassicogethes aeneus TaxID=1431903 RepID=A0A9P0BDD0_BRAAE|nr:unnamed protein product [Brassicogethes aeneus]
MYSRRNENPTTKLLLVAVFLCVCVVQSKICPTLDIRNDIVQLNKLKNCTAVTGNLSIVLLEKVKSPAEYEKYVFPDLTEITGYLVLYKVFHLLSVGTIMPNLRVIRGVDLISYYSLALHEMPHLTQDNFFVITTNSNLIQ